MKSVRTRIAGALAVGAMTTVGVVVGSPPASSAVTFASPVYFCTPDNTAVAARQYSFGFFGEVIGIQDFTTKNLLLTLNGQLNPYGIAVPNNPVLPVTFSANLPAAVPPSAAFSPSVNFSVTLPTDLTDAVRLYLGIPSVIVKNTTIRINTTNTAPSSFLGTIASQTVPLVTGAAATGVATGSLTTGLSGGISLFPSVAHVELDLGSRYIDAVNVSGIYVPVHLLLLTSIFDCAPTTNPSLGSTVIDPNAPPITTTTTVPGATTTTAAATTTTAAATTTTVAGATTTTLVPITNPAYCTWPIFVWFQAVPWFCAPPPPSIP